MEGANKTLKTLKFRFNSMQKQDKKPELNKLDWQDFVHVFANLQHLTLFSANI